ncbi:MAG: DUF2254 domain-containing protein [Rhodanobacteraceae bacterium]
MFSRLQWVLLQLSRQMWVRATAFSLLGVVSALLALWIKRYIPGDFPAKIGADAVDSLLGIIATSMLSVTIFSLSTMVAAFSAATSNTTPRATRLLSADSTAQNALATFIGSFLFSLVGIIVLKTGLYGDTGRVVLYIVTLFVIVLIVITLLRWTDHVLGLGRVGPTSQRVEEAATRAMRLRRKTPYLGGQPRGEDGSDIPAGAHALHSETFGYVEHIDMQAIHDAAETADLQVHIITLPGHLAGAGRPLACVAGSMDKDSAGAIRDSFSVGAVRSFDQDPRFGACVLSEIASRALSPAINDPGTAIDILTRGTRVLAVWSQPRTEAEDKDDTVRFPRVHVPPVRVDELFDDFFVPIARDGAGMVEVGVHVQKMLQMLAQLGDARHREAATRHSKLALARAEYALTLDSDIERVRAAARKVQCASNPPGSDADT